MLTRVLLAAVLLMALSVRVGHTQQWTNEQQEVWQTIESAFFAFTSGDTDAAYRDYVHPDFVFWNTGNAVPGNRSTAKTLDTAFHGSVGTKWHGATITPLTILVYDDVATAHAYIRGYQETGGEKPTWKTIRWTSVWKKEAGQWLQALNYAHVE